MRRTCIRIFIVFIVASMIVQSIPWPSDSIAIQNPWTRLLDRVGLWQRSWTLFAPDPKSKVSWLTAEIVHHDGTTTQWSSTDWHKASMYEKFVKFRHLNYYNRFDQPMIQEVTDDLADYLRRQSPDPANVRRVSISLNSFSMVIPEDGTPLQPDTVMQVFSIKPLGDRVWPSN